MSFDEEPMHFLGGVGLFAGLGENALAELAARSAVVPIKAGEWLFRQGEAGRELFVLATGRLELIVESPPPARLVRILPPGAVIGELALLTRSTRSASVRARRDSRVIAVGRDAFEGALRADPEMALALVRLLGEKLGVSTDLAPAPATPPAVFALVCAGPGLPIGAVRQAAVATLQQWGTMETLSDADVNSASDDDARAAMLDKAEAAKDRVLIVAEDVASQWGRFCLRQADRSLMLIGRDTPVPRDDGVRLVADIGVCGPVPPVVIGAWRRALQPAVHHHLRPHERSDVAMAIRRMAGRSTGIVLSGGGARGLAHIGVLHVLHSAGVEIDRIGGCSMGALVGALAATGRTPDEIESVCRDELVRRKPFSDYTVPRVALIRGVRARQMLSRMFGAGNVEALLYDFFCVSADLFTAEVVVHRTGPLAEAVGMSMSLPGFAPPVNTGDHLAVDGGVLDNLPVDVMAAAGEGPVIGVDVMSRRGSFASDTRLPGIVETIARATVLGSWRWVDANRSAADVIVQPDVHDAGLFDFRRVDQLIDAGRRAAEALLPQITTVTGPDS